MHIPQPPVLCAFVVSHPLGSISVWFTPLGLARIDLGATCDVRVDDLPTARLRKQSDRFRAALDRYLSGRHESFANVDLDLGGATPFRRRVWETARHVPFGEVSSYGGLARLIGATRGHARAIGQALGSNPVPIVVPCHRFLAGDGGIGGFTGGLHWKRALLGLEGVVVVDKTATKSNPDQGQGSLNL